MSDLKAKLYQIADLVHEILTEKNTIRVSVPVEELKKTAEKLVEEAKAEIAAEAPKKGPGRPPKAKAEEPVKGPEPAKVEAEERVGAVVAEVAEPDLEDMFDEKPVVQRTVADIKTLLMDWAAVSPDRKDRAVKEFTKATGFHTIKNLTQEQIDEAYPKLEAHLKATK